MRMLRDMAALRLVAPLRLAHATNDDDVVNDVDAGPHRTVMRAILHRSTAPFVDSIEQAIHFTIEREQRMRQAMLRGIIRMNGSREISRHEVSLITTDAEISLATGVPLLTQSNINSLRFNFAAL